MSEAAAFIASPAAQRRAGGAIRGRLNLRRSLKLAVALALLGGGGYAILSGQGLVASDNAIVSAYTSSLRTPVAGAVSGVHVRVGDAVPSGAVIAHVTENRIDDGRLVDLESQLVRIRADTDAYRRQHGGLSAMLAGLVRRADARNQAEADYLDLQAAEAERQSRSRDSARAFARRDLDRKASLGRSGFAALSDVDRANMASDQAAHDADAGQVHLAYTRLQAASARRGVLLESGSNDVPYSRQRADEVTIRLAEIDRLLASLAANEAETLTRRDAERARIALLRDADLVAPSAGMVWRLGASGGERLAAGDTVAELVDCQDTFIVATIPQASFPDIALSGMARVRLSGESSDRIGRVMSVTGHASFAADRHLAAIPADLHSATVMVQIELPPAGNSTACAIGRTARVLLPVMGHGGLAGLASLLF